MYISYFKRIGRNVGSKKIVESTNAATLICIISTVVAIISTIVMVVLASVLRDQPRSLQIARDVSFGINMLLGFGTLACMIAMTNTTLDALQRR